MSRKGFIQLAERKNLPPTVKEYYYVVVEPVGWQEQYPSSKTNHSLRRNSNPNHDSICNFLESNQISPMINIRRKSQINDFERLDGDGEVEVEGRGDSSTSKPSQKENGEEYPTDRTAGHSRAIKKSHSVKAIAKAKKLVKKSRYSSLDGAFPTAVVGNNDNKERKSTIDLTSSPSVIIPMQSSANLPNATNGESKDEYYFEANFEDVESVHNKDHYFEAIFEDDCEDASNPVASPKINFEESSEHSNTKANLPKKNDPVKGSDGRPSTPNTLASSSISSDSRPSTPGTSVSPSTSAEDSSVEISASSNEMSTPDKSVKKTTKKKVLSKKNSAYQKLDHNSASDDDNVQLELEQRLKAIHKLKDVTMEQSKKIKKMQISNKANKIRLILFRKEINYLRLQNADLKERVTKLEDDLKTAKDDAVVSEEEVNRMCTALVLICDEIDDAENRAEKLDENFKVEDSFERGEGDNANVATFDDDNHSNNSSNSAEGVEEMITKGDTIADEVTSTESVGIEFDAFGLYVKDGKEENETL